MARLLRSLQLSLRTKLLLPLVFVTEMAFTVAFGVLLDTLVVRSLLVPALTVDADRVVWWPGKLWRDRDESVRHAR